MNMQATTVPGAATQDTTKLPLGDLTNERESTEILTAPIFILNILWWRIDCPNRKPFCDRMVRYDHAALAAFIDSDAGERAA
ncbi:MAG: hypothetical protein L0H70_04975 [Xanthomonadales bacterium]|nr:hypothetical protein [Xanthomonadales bacterium]